MSISIPYYYNFTKEELETEQWKELEEYPKYKFSNLGRVRMLNGKISNRKIRKDGRIQSEFKNKDGKFIPKGVHILIALVWIPNPENKKTVDHIISTEPWNNRVSNLRWATQVEQMQNISERQDRSRNPINQYTLEGIFIKQYETIDDLPYNEEERIRISKCKGLTGLFDNYLWCFHTDIEVLPREIWKETISFDGNKIIVSSYGRIKNKYRITYGSLKTDGYYSIGINGKNYQASRVICLAFNPPSEELLEKCPLEELEVDHLDENTQNNHINNLEFVTNSENKRRHLKLNPNKDMSNYYRAVQKIDKDTNEVICEYKSITEATIDLGLTHNGSISSTCRGVTRTSNGFLWKYKEEETNVKYVIKEIGRHIQKFSLSREFICEYKSIKEAAEDIGLPNLSCISSISMACRGKIKNTKGFIWKYKENSEREKKVKKLTLEGEFICEYKSIREAARDIGLKSPSRISCVCQGKAKTSGNFRWEYSN